MKTNSEDSLNLFSSAVKSMHVFFIYNIYIYIYMYIGPSNFFKFGRFKLQSMDDLSTKFQPPESVCIVFMLFAYKKLNVDLGVEGTLAPHVAQNCQWLSHIPPWGFAWSFLWLLPSVHLLFEDCSHTHCPWDTLIDKNLGVQVWWMRCPLNITPPADQSVIRSLSKPG